jgi:hypothetical protein
VPAYSSVLAQTVIAASSPRPAGPRLRAAISPVMIPHAEMTTVAVAVPSTAAEDEGLRPMASVPMRLDCAE